MALTAEAVEMMIRTYHDAKQWAAQFDWSGDALFSTQDGAGVLLPLFRGISAPGPQLDHLVAPGQMTVGTGVGFFRVQDDAPPIDPTQGDLLHGREPRRSEEPLTEGATPSETG